MSRAPFRSIPAAAVTVAAASVLAAPGVALAQPVEITSVTKLAPSPDESSDLDFGHDVARDGDVLVVGLPGDAPGSVRVFRLVGDAWTLEQELFPSFAGASQFGYSVDIDGEHLVVGSPEDQGSVHFFRLDGGAWTPAGTVSSPSGSDDGFGHAVALDGTTAIVGAPADAAGSASIFDFGPGGWTLIQTLTPSDPDDDHYGESVDIDGDRAIVGAPEDDGSASVYLRTDGTWIEQQRIPAPFDSDDDFGAAVAIEGQRLIVGAPDGDADGYASVHVLADDAWMLEQILLPFGPGDETDFGERVDLLGDLAIVGAPGNDNGTAFLFQRSGDPADWQGVERLRDPGNENDDEVGYSVALDPAGAVVGAPEDDDATDGAGAVLVFAFDAGCPADLDGDGAVALTDLLTLLSSFGTCPGCPADLDDDGAVDFDDLVALLGDFGPCS